MGHITPVNLSMAYLLLLAVGSECPTDGSSSCEAVWESVGCFLNTEEQGVVAAVGRQSWDLGVGYLKELCYDMHRESRASEPRTFLWRVF